MCNQPGFLSEKRIKKRRHNGLRGYEMRVFILHRLLKANPACQKHKNTLPFEANGSAL